jgi:MFS family permease
MGYLLFLPFLIHGRGGSSATVGIALALLFIGGAFGKASCTWLSERLGVVGSVMATEAATTLLIVATLFTPLILTLIVLPLLGIVLNGTSSVLYGTVPELAPGGDTSRPSRSSTPASSARAGSPRSSMVLSPTIAARRSGSCLQD